MEKEILADLSTISRVKDFSRVICAFDCDVEVQSGRYIVDAKSIMGLFSLNLLEPLIVRIRNCTTEEIESFNRVMEEFKFESNN